MHWIAKKWDTPNGRSTLLARCYGAILILDWLILVMCVIGIFLFIEVNNINNSIKQNRISGYQNRAVSCLVLSNEHAPIPKECLDPHVKPLWQP